MSDQAEIERLRAALQGLMPFCAEDFPAHPDDLNLACVAPAYLRAYKAALEVLSGEPPSPDEPTARRSGELLPCENCGHGIVAHVQNGGNCPTPPLKSFGERWVCANSHVVGSEPTCPVCGMGRPESHTVEEGECPWCTIGRLRTALEKIRGWTQGDDYAVARVCNEALGALHPTMARILEAHDVPPQTPNTDLLSAAKGIVKLLEDVGNEVGWDAGSHTDRVYAWYEFDDLRAAIARIENRICQHDFQKPACTAIADDPRHAHCTVCGTTWMILSGEPTQHHEPSVTRLLVPGSRMARLSDIADSLVREMRRQGMETLQAVFDGVKVRVEPWQDPPERTTDEH